MIITHSVKLSADDMKHVTGALRLIKRHPDDQTGVGECAREISRHVEALCQRAFEEGLKFGRRENAQTQQPRGA